MKPHVVVALLILVLGNIFSALYDVSIKWLPQDADVVTFLLIRQLGCVLMLLPLWLIARRPNTADFKLQLLRSNIGVVTSIALVIGLLSLPLGTVSSLFFSAPIIIIVLGHFWLKEQVSMSQWLITLLGFVGIIILLRPSEMSWAGLVVLIAAVAFSVNQITLRKLPQTDSPIVTLLLYNLLSIPVLVIIGGSIGFGHISWSLIGLSIVSNILILAYHLCCIFAYKNAQASDIAVAEYSGLLFCIFFGWLWFGEWLDALSWVGASLIVLPSLVIPFAMKYFTTRSAKALVS
ncbi:DMT family transporter [Shewanella sp. 10N.7]|uniref:DMT family transporter n=1 Tax=Shewanella sp. 10N.7 TaxID=2885093 RepID=UPI001E32C5EF|nr:DMT family transporter [Shewanella sp. 10N.7]MCC4833918.1 DMT family transporter [Shewanella sp. 10N.7]